MRDAIVYGEVRAGAALTSILLCDESIFPDWWNIQDEDLQQPSSFQRLRLQVNKGSSEKGFSLHFLFLKFLHYSSVKLKVFMILINLALHPQL